MNLRNPKPAAPCPARRHAFSAAAALALAASALSPVAQAADRKPATNTAKAEHAMSFDIAPKPLEEAINDFIAATDWQVGFPAALAKGVRSPGVSGRFTPSQALQKLLAGTGISARSSAKGMVTLEKNAVPANPDRAPTKPIAPQSDATLLPAVTVTAQQQRAIESANSYSLPRTFTATKTDTPFLETPATVNVVTQKQMEDRQVIDTQQAFQYTPGVNPGNGNRNPYDAAFNLRGFSTAEQPGALGGYYYRDGFRMSGIPLPVASLDHLELLKGPASVLYGRAEPGGLINAVYKRPQDEPYYRLEQQFGSYGLYRTIAEATGPVASNKDLLYRFDLQNIQQGSFRQGINNNLFSVSPMLTWNASEDTRINFQFEYLRNEWNYPSAIPIIGNRPAAMSPSAFLGDGLTGNPDWRSDTYIGSIDLTHRFNEDWSLRWNSLYAHQNLTGVTPVKFNSIDEVTGDATGANIVAEPNNPQRNWWFTMLNLTGNVDTFGVKNKLLFGFDYNNEHYHAPWYGKFGSPGDFGIVKTFNIYHPVYGQVAHPTLRGVEADFANNGYDLTQINRWYGFYIQDQIELTKQLRLVLGGRYDHAEWAFNYTNALDPQTTERLNPRYGIVFEPFPWLSAYYQYVQSFGTPNGRPRPGETLSPETSTQHEGGLKAEFFDRRLNATVAYFHLTKNNFQSTDPNNINYSIAVGQALSQGVEVNVVGQVMDRLNLILAYTYDDTEITKGSGSNATVGNQLSNVPKNAGSLWATYDITDEFKLGAGVYAAGTRQGDLANSYQLPAYARLDLMGSYRFTVGKSRFTTQVNINNALDKQYYANSDNSRFGAYPGQPLTVIGSVKFEY